MRETIAGWCLAIVGVLAAAPSWAAVLGNPGNGRLYSGIGAERRRAQRGAWDDLVRGRNADRWETGERAYQEPDYPDPRDYVPRGIEPGHIPYNCDHITGNARARRDCQESWEASDPNEHLNYGR